jgi:hypothetical protein
MGVESLAERLRPASRDAAASGAGLQKRIRL